MKKIKEKKFEELGCEFKNESDCEEDVEEEGLEMDKEQGKFFEE
jgi:hypothetical protein